MIPSASATNMKRGFFLLLVTVYLAFFNASCKRHRPEDCSLYFSVNFINKNTGECYKDIDTLLSTYGLDTLCLYSNPNSWGGVKGKCLFRRDGVPGNCISMISSGRDFDKRTNPTFIYALGKFPNFIDTIEFKYSGSSAEIRINGVLQEQKATCSGKVELNITK